jgi:thymidine phosphorylase
MDNPLGLTVGNAIEVQEALDALSGNGDEELLEVCVRVTREMCELAGVKANVGEVLRSGAGRQKFEQMLSAQGGHLERGLPTSAVRSEVMAERDGYVEGIDALEIGLAGIELGAGRVRKEDKVDPSAGFTVDAPVGKRVGKGESLVTVHARSQELIDRVAPRLRAAWRLSDREVRRPPHVLARVDKNGVTKGD